MAGDPFDRFVAAVDHAMVAVTVADGDGRPAGCLVGFHTQVSIDPPRYMVCLSSANHTYSVAREADVLAVHLLGSGDAALARVLGGETEDEDPRKFTRVRWSPHPRFGTPVLDGPSCWLLGQVRERVDAGDHVMFVLSPLEARAPQEPPEPLRLDDASSIEPGHPS